MLSFSANFTSSTFLTTVDSIFSFSGIDTVIKIGLGVFFGIWLLKFIVKFITKPHK